MKLLSIFRVSLFVAAMAVNPTTAQLSSSTSSPSSGSSSFEGTSAPSSNLSGSSTYEGSSEGSHQSSTESSNESSSEVSHQSSTGSSSQSSSGEGTAAPTDNSSFEDSTEASSQSSSGADTRVSLMMYKAVPGTASDPSGPSSDASSRQSSLRAPASVSTNSELSNSQYDDLQSSSPPLASTWVAIGMPLVAIASMAFLFV
eukprot:jgi/Psemu1/301499/fgenesh1_kg.36_\